MSALLLINPVAPSGPSQGHAAVAMDGKEAIPVKPVSDSSRSGDLAADLRSDNGRSTSKQATNVALLQAGIRDSWNWPTGATGRSVINAQADQNDNPFGINLPEVEMPYPLPTSPILMRNAE